MTREPGPVKGGKSVIAFIEDPDGYKFELLERGPTPEPLCQIMLRVGDLDRSIEFYKKVSSCHFIAHSNMLHALSFSHSCRLTLNFFYFSLKAFGMDLLRRRDNPEYKVIFIQLSELIHTSFSKCLCSILNNFSISTKDEEFHGSSVLVSFRSTIILLQLLLIVLAEVFKCFFYVYKSQTCTLMSE